MNLHGLVSNYTVEQFKIHKSLCNNDIIENSLNREFNRKTEFAFNRCFNSFEELETELFDYVNWYNNIRIHSSLNYETPVNYRMLNALNISDKNCTKKC